MLPIVIILISTVIFFVILSIVITNAVTNGIMEARRLHDETADHNGRLLIRQSIAEVFEKNDDAIKLTIKQAITEALNEHKEARNVNSPG